MAGDAGQDRLEGGDGADSLFGGKVWIRCSAGLGMMG
ncbi:hypothetical protein [Tabrizicola sp. M-4]